MEKDKQNMIQGKIISFKGALILGILLSLFFTINNIFRIINLALTCSSITTCSDVFLSNKTQESIVLRLQCPAFTDSFSSSTVDYNGKKVKSSFLWIVEKTAIYLENYRGCSLQIRSEIYNMRLPRKQRFRLDKGFPWPLGNMEKLECSPEYYAAFENLFSGYFEDEDYGMKGIAIVKDGKMIYEKYGKNLKWHNSFRGYELGNAIMSAIIGLRVDSKSFSLDSKISDYLNAWKYKKYENITVDNLLSMTSRIEWNENSNPFDDDLVESLYGGQKSYQKFISKDVSNDPAFKWRYSSGSSLLLSYFNRINFPNLELYWVHPSRDLFEKIGATSMVLQIDPDGNFASDLSYSNARDWARLGLLFLENGIWNGTRLLSQKWIENCVTATPESKGLYGRLWWTAKTDRDNLMGTEYEFLANQTKLIPKDSYFQYSNSGNLLLVIPSQKLVIVRSAIEGLPHFEWGKMVKEIIGIVK